VSFPIDNNKYILAFDNLNAEKDKLIIIKNIESDDNSIHFGEDQTELNIKYNNCRLCTYLQYCVVK
jgi:hypothetical protein